MIDVYYKHVKVSVMVKHVDESLFIWSQVT